MFWVPAFAGTTETETLPNLPFTGDFLWYLGLPHGRDHLDDGLLCRA
jgi:hypothetical protein